MPILRLVFSRVGELAPIPFIIFCSDLMITTFVRLAFGTTSGFFRYRIRLGSQRRGSQTGSHGTPARDAFLRRIGHK